MNESDVIKLSGRQASSGPLIELLNTGAGQLIYYALEAELEDWLYAHWRVGLISPNSSSKSSSSSFLSMSSRSSKVRELALSGSLAEKAHFGLFPFLKSLF